MAHMLIIGGTGTSSAWEKGFFEKKGFDVAAAAGGKERAGGGEAGRDRRNPDFIRPCRMGTA